MHGVWGGRASSHHDTIVIVLPWSGTMLDCNLYMRPDHQAPREQQSHLAVTPTAPQPLGVKKLTTETGAGQWGSALAFATSLLGMDCEVIGPRVEARHTSPAASVSHSYIYVRCPRTHLHTPTCARSGSAGLIPQMSDIPVYVSQLLDLSTNVRLLHTLCASAVPTLAPINPSQKSGVPHPCVARRCGRCAHRMTPSRTGRR